MTAARRSSRRAASLAEDVAAVRHVRERTQSPAHHVRPNQRLHTPREIQPEGPARAPARSKPEAHSARPPRSAAARWPPTPGGAAARAGARLMEAGAPAGPMATWTHRCAATWRMTVKMAPAAASVPRAAAAAKAAAEAAVAEAA
eukprot:2996654-Prymnesium_polylepis.1